MQHGAMPSSVVATHLWRAICPKARHFRLAAVDEIIYSLRAGGAVLFQVCCEQRGTRCHNVAALVVATCGAQEAITCQLKRDKTCRE